jgi:hypothetical protein
VYLLQAFDINGLAPFASEPIALIILGVFVVLGLICWKVLPKFIDKKAETKMNEHDKLYNSVQEENKAILENISNRFTIVEECIEKKKKKIEQIQINLDEFKKEQLNQSRNILRMAIFDESQDIYSRLEAGCNYIKRGGNNKAREKFIELGIHNPEAFDRVINKQEEYHQDPEYFKNTVYQINNLIRT